VFSRAFSDFPGVTMPQGPNINGYELTKIGMQALFAQMGYPNTAIGELRDDNATIDLAKLEQQGFMPILTGAGTSKDSGHWIMLIKGKDRKYYLYDPLGEASGKNFKGLIQANLRLGSTLAVIPTEPGLHQGLTGYCVASTGIKALTEINQSSFANIGDLGQYINQKMKDETAGTGLKKIKAWLAGIAKDFSKAGQPQAKPVDAGKLRERTERDVTAKPKGKTTSRDWDSFSMYDDKGIEHAIQWAFDKHLGTPYTGPVEKRPANFGGKLVYRQHHGLSHTLRTMAYAQVIVEEARKAKLRGERLAKAKNGQTLADVTPEELKKIMIAQAFFVAGRDDENSEPEKYYLYHKQSRDAFLNYVNSNRATLIPDVFKDDGDVMFYADIIEDKKNEWGKTPAHVLIHQGHMVDLMRVKQPAESYLHSFYSTMHYWIGGQATEAVFAKQRQFFHATHEAVSKIDPNNKEQHLVWGDNKGMGFYMIGPDGNPVRENNRGKQGKLKFISADDPLPLDHRYMRVNEFLALEEIRKNFPFDKVIEGGLPGLDYNEYAEYLNHSDRARCENDVDFCLKELNAANESFQVKSYFQAQSYLEKRVEKVKPKAKPEEVTAEGPKEKRKPNPDEIAALKIIQQILADPDSIKDDHVLLNGQPLNEQFFRDLLKKCDMGIVGSGLEEQDFRNINTLMKHEYNTPFHEPGEGVTTQQDIGKEWENVYLPRNPSIKNSLVDMMQDGSWYYRRLNAVAQGRDSGSTFKEVMLTALLIPATRKALVDTQPYVRKAPPKSVFRGMADLPEEFKKSLMQQSEAIIAHSSPGLLTDSSAQLYHQMQLNHFTHVFGKTCLSTAANETSASVFGLDSPGHNIMVQIDDPDGVLEAMRVSAHPDNALGENEYSLYLTDDVALIPVQIVNRNQRDKADLLRLVAVKSPDFSPRHESGFALAPFLKMQALKIEPIMSAIEQSRLTCEQLIQHLYQETSTQARRPIRDFWERLSHSFSKTDDGKISYDRKNFYTLQILPVLAEAQTAIHSKNVEAMKIALSKFPTKWQWGLFSSTETDLLKADFYVLQENLTKQIIEQEAAAQFSQCIDSLKRTNVADALQALPEDGQWTQSTMGSTFQALRKELVELHLAAKPKIGEEQRAKLKERFDAYFPEAIKRVESSITVLEQQKCSDNESYEKFVNQARNLLKELNILKSEKMHCSENPSTVDVSDLIALESRIHKAAGPHCKHLVSKLDFDITYVKTPTQYCQAEENLNQQFQILSNLERLLGSSEIARLLKKDIAEVKEELIDLEKAYPKAVEFEYKAELLVSHLRKVCNAHLNGLSPPNRGDDSYYMNTIWAYAFGDSDDYTAQKIKFNELTNFKKILNDPSKDSLEILAQLATKSTKNLREAFGFSATQAETLAKNLERFPEELLTSVDNDMSPIKRDSTLTEALNLVEKTWAAITEPKTSDEPMGGKPDQRAEIR
jgi:effector protein SdeA